jgi:DNA-binding response OmpR family regulator
MNPSDLQQVRGDGAHQDLPAGALPRVLLALMERPDLGELVRLLLALRLVPLVALNLRHALSLITALHLDMLVIDGQLLTAAGYARAEWPPLIDKVTVLGSATSKVPADIDVIDAAVSYVELSVLVREALNNRHAGVLRRGALEIDLRRREARWQNVRLDISPLQLRLLTVLMEANGAVVSKADLAWRLFGNTSLHDERIETHVRRIRHRLAEHKGGNQLLLTVRGEGYRLESMTEPTPAQTIVQNGLAGSSFVMMLDASPQLT